MTKEISKDCKAIILAMQSIGKADLYMRLVDLGKKKSSVEKQELMLLKHEMSMVFWYKHR